MSEVRYKVRRYVIPAGYWFEVWSGGDVWARGRRFGWRARERAIDKARTVVLEVASVVKPS